MPMDAMTCRSPRACASCEHADRFGGCTLEAALTTALAPRPRTPATSIPVALRSFVHTPRASYAEA